VSVNQEEARRLLDKIGVLRHPCDLDLLVFFARHRRTLLTSEQVAVWLGYEIKRIAASLELLLEAGFVTRSQNPTHAARMYVFAVGGTWGGWLPQLLAVASTRQGRLALLDALSARAPKETNGPKASTHAIAAARPRPRLVSQKSDATSHTKLG
jgi:hypothetical protein